MIMVDSLFRRATSTPLRDNVRLELEVLFDTVKILPFLSVIDEREKEGGKHFQSRDSYLLSQRHLPC